MKLLGSLIMSQSILKHQSTTYSSIWQDYDVKTLLDALIIGSLFILAMFHLVRLSHFIPDSFKGEYQLIA